MRGTAVLPTTSLFVLDPGESIRVIFCTDTAILTSVLRRERPSYIITIDLKAGSVEPEHWIKRGTALLLSLQD